MNMQHRYRQAALTWTCNIDVDVQYLHGLDTDIQHQQRQAALKNGKYILRWCFNILKKYFLFYQWPFQNTSDSILQNFNLGKMDAFIKSTFCQILQIWRNFTLILKNTKYEISQIFCTVLLHKKFAGQFNYSMLKPVIFSFFSNSPIFSKKCLCFLLHNAKHLYEK